MTTAKFGYLCACGVGAECSELAWVSAGRPRKVDCWECGRPNRWKPANLVPVQAAMNDLAADRWGTGAFLLLVAVLLAALLSGWLGRIMGAAAVILNTLPPHS
jgi:hypothetical protein